jgi:hypothetical protein
MQLIPNSLGTFIEFNPCHLPAGSAEGGRFCDKDAFVPGPGWASPTQTLLAQWRPELRARVARAQSKLTALMAADGNEHLAVAIRGEPLSFHTSGSPVEVTISEDLFDQLVAVDLTAPGGLEFTAHTHPSGSAPSLQDLRTAVATGVMRELIFGPNGDWYELHVTDLAKAQAALEVGRRRPSLWESGTKGKFHTAFDRERRKVKERAFQDADTVIAQKTGWQPQEGRPGQGLRRQRGRPAGFLVPDMGWVSRATAVKLADQRGLLKLADINAYAKQRFSLYSPDIWKTLAAKHADWLTFRYHRRGEVLHG